MFKARESFAINLSDASIEALELSRSRGQLTAKAYNRVLLESGVVEDGAIKDEEKLLEAVQQLLREAKPEAVTSKEVIVTLPESKVFSQSISLPKNIGSKQVSAALYSQAKELLPIDIELIAADYIETRKEGDIVDYLFVATYKELVQSYTSFFQKVGLKVTMVTMESLALGAAILDSNDEETSLVLDVGARTTIASIFTKGKLRETININIAGVSITKALAEKLKISLSEAEQRKRTLGLDSGGGDGAEMLIIQGQLQPLKDELLLFIKYFEEKTGETIGKVLLAGGTSSLAGIDEYFASNLGLPVSRAVPVESVSSPDDTVQSPTFLVVLGLARIAFGEKKAALNFLSKSEKDWLPGKKFESGKRLSTINADESQKSGDSKKNTSKGRTVFLVIVLILVLLAFGGVLGWRYLSSQEVPFIPNQTQPVSEDQRNVGVIIRPFSATDPSTNDKSLSFQFALETGGGESGAPDVFRARKEDLVVEGEIQYDESTSDFVRREYDDGLYEDRDFDEVIVDLMSDRLWSEQFAALSEDVSNGILLDTYFAKNVTASEVISDENEEGVTTLSITMVVTVLIVEDVDAFRELENEQVEFYQAVSDAGNLLQKRYYYTENNSRIRVQSIYQFE